MPVGNASKYGKHTIDLAPTIFHLRDSPQAILQHSRALRIGPRTRELRAITFEGYFEPTGAAVPSPWPGFVYVDDVTIE